ncbi:MAG: NADH-quinone oxidoreductase subunit A [Bacteroidota bacterium]|nr:NADH-quinone oxidoreductase subunit A [Bacteroidota bacterium]
MIITKIYIPQDYLPVIIQTIIVFGFVGTTILITHLLGPNRNTKEKLENFECGIESFGNARSPFSVKYFLIAILFVLFDVQVIFFYPWALNLKELGNQGFFEMLFFLGVLIVGFIYIVLKDAFKWNQ